MNIAARFAPIARAFGTRDFLFFVGAYTPVQIGNWGQRVAIGWLTWQLTESATWLGLMGFAELVPSVLFSPIAGVIADRFDRLWIARIANANNAVQAAVLTVLMLTGLLSVEILFALTLMYGTGSAFYQPVRQALVVMLVPKQDLPAAVAITSISFQTARFIGPAFAGIIIVSAGVAPAFAFAALMYFPFLWVLWHITPEPQILAKPSGKGVGGDIFEGYRYALTHPGIGPLLIMILASSLFVTPIMHLLPGFAEAVFERGAAGLAWMTSMAGFGAMMAGLYLAQHAELKGLTKVATISLAGAGIFLFAFTTTSNFAVAVGCIALISCLQVINGVSIMTLIQSSIDKTMMGRVLSLYWLFWLGGAALGSLIMGYLSSRFGLRIPPAVTAFLALIVGLEAIRRTPKLARIMEPATEDE